MSFLNGTFTKHSYRPAPNAQDEDAQVKVWTEILDILENITPGVKSEAEVKVAEPAKAGKITIEVKELEAVAVEC
jgi:hypothetical protein